MATALETLERIDEATGVQVITIERPIEYGASLEYSPDGLRVWDVHSFHSSADEALACYQELAAECSCPCPERWRVIETVATHSRLSAVCRIPNAWGIEVGERVEVLGSYKAGEEYGEGRFWDVATFRVRQRTGRVTVLPQRWFQVEG